MFFLNMKLWTPLALKERIPVMVSLHSLQTVQWMIAACHRKLCILSSFSFWALHTRFPVLCSSFESSKTCQVISTSAPNGPLVRVFIYTSLWTVQPFYMYFSVITDANRLYVEFLRRFGWFIHTCFYLYVIADSFAAGSGFLGSSQLQYEVFTNCKAVGQTGTWSANHRYFINISVGIRALLVVRQVGIPISSQ